MRESDQNSEAYRLAMAESDLDDEIENQERRVLEACLNWYRWPNDEQFRNVVHQQTEKLVHLNERADRKAKEASDGG